MRAIARLPFTIGALMIGVSGFAVFFTVLRVLDRGLSILLLLCTVGPTCGAVAQRCRGGSGISGGIIGGLVYFLGYGVVMCAWVFFFPQPNVVYFPGPVLALFVLAIVGATFGLSVGLLIWGFMLSLGSLRERVERLG